MQQHIADHPRKIQKTTTWWKWDGTMKSSRKHGVLLRMSTRSFSNGIWVAWEHSNAPPIGDSFLAELYPFESNSFPTLHQWKWSNGILGRMRIIDGQKRSQTELHPTSQEVASYLGRELFNSFSNDVAAFFYSLSTGDKTRLSKELKKSFQDAGLSHLLAVSGYHVGWISLLPIFLIKRRKRIIRVMGILGMLGIWCYLDLCQWPASGIRAAIMASIYSASLFFNVRIGTIQSMSIAAILMYWYNPAIALDLGVQLSFLAVFSILLFIRFMKRFGINWAMAAGIPVAAQLGTLFISVSSFGFIPIYFLPFNLMAGIIMTGVGTLFFTWILMIIGGASDVIICGWSDMTSGLLESLFNAMINFCNSHALRFYPPLKYEPLWLIISASYFFLMIRLSCSRNNLIRIPSELTCFAGAILPWCL